MLSKREALYFSYLHKKNFRRIGSCDTKDELKKPGWAQTTEGKNILLTIIIIFCKNLNFTRNDTYLFSGRWVTVINMHEYPQEVKTVQCKNELSSCSLSYSKKPR